MKTTLISIGQPLRRLGGLLKLLIAGAFLTGLTVGVRASDPNGIYAYVDRVVFEPSEAKPERIQVWGGFALSKGDRGYEYHDAQRGYLYFKLRTGEEDICKKEWADLKAVAGTGQLVTFGSRYAKTPVTVRKPDAKVENADVHPPSSGITKVKPRDYSPINQLLKLQGRKAVAKESSETPGK
jgi:hypothetical protein